jgi:hypothetical protein
VAKAKNVLFPGVLQPHHPSNGYYTQPHTPNTNPYTQPPSQKTTLTQFHRHRSEVPTRPVDLLGAGQVPHGETVLLSHCCYTVVTLWLHCCYNVVTLLLHCCYTIVTLLSHWPLDLLGPGEGPHGKTVPGGKVTPLYHNCDTTVTPL